MSDMARDPELDRARLLQLATRDLIIRSLLEGAGIIEPEESECA